MGGQIYEVLNTLIGEGLSIEIGKTMTDIWANIQELMTNGLVAHATTTFSAIAASLLLIYFLMDVIGMISKEMVSLELLVKAFIKLLVGAALILTNPIIIESITTIGQKMTEWMTTPGGFYADLMNYESPFTLGGITKEQFIDNFGFKECFFHPSRASFAVSMLLAYLVTFFVRIIAYFLVVSNAIMIIVRAIFSPIAIVQCFDGETKSVGVRYLKSYAAECLLMPCMILIVFAAGFVTKGILEGNDVAAAMGMFENMDAFINSLKSGNWGLLTIAKLLVPQLAMVGGMAGASKIAHDVIG